MYRVHKKISGVTLSGEVIIITTKICATSDEVVLNHTSRTCHSPFSEAINYSFYQLAFILSEVLVKTPKQL